LKLALAYVAFEIKSDFYAGIFFFKEGSYLLLKVLFYVNVFKYK